MDEVVEVFDGGAEQQARMTAMHEAALAAYSVTRWAVRASEVPVVVGLVGGTHHEEVETALLDLLHVFGLRVTSADDPVPGSWWRRFTAGVSAHAPSPDQLAATLERGVTLNSVEKFQADVDLKQADAVSKLINALDKEADAAIQIGSILLLKVNVSYVVRTLTPLEMRELSRDPAMLLSPATVLGRLGALVLPEAQDARLCKCGSGIRAELCHSLE